MRKIVWLVVLLFFAQKLSSQNKELAQTNQQWFQYVNVVSIKPKKLVLQNDLGIRFKDGFSSWILSNIRSGLYYSFNERLRLGAGLASFNHMNEGTWSRMETRAFIDLLHDKKGKKITFAERGRAEYRYFNTIANNKVSGNTGGYTRYRYRFIFSFPLIVKEASSLSFTLGDEILFNSKKISVSYFDSNRVLSGFAYKIGKKLELSFTYNFFFTQQSTSVNNLQHTAWFSVVHRMN